MIGCSSKASRHFVHLAIKTLALIIIYAAYGLLQERIVKGHYPSGVGSDSDAFQSAPLLVLCNRLTSLATGLVIAKFQSANARNSLLPQAKANLHQPQISQRVSSLLSSIYPASPFLHYALVAGLNNAATVSQYASLSYLSFTTSTLGKTAKMVPILIIGHFWYGKQYKRHQWIGTFVVIAGIWGYLASIVKVGESEDEREKAVAKDLVGILCLFTYLFFDGLTSTIQERLFGNVKSDEESPSRLGITSGLIDQMIWVNLFSSLIAFCLLLLSPRASTVFSLKLIIANPLLQIHIFLLSITATLGLLILFHVIGTYGALVAGLIMTVRQFVSIITNATTFGNMSEIPLPGWAGIGFIVAGIWIKMNRSSDRAVDSVGEKISGQDGCSSEGLRKGRGMAGLLYQYGIPLVLCPFVFVFIAGINDAVTRSVVMQLKGE